LNKLLAGGLFGQGGRIVTVIIAANVAWFVLSLLFSQRGPGLAMPPFRFLSPDNQSLLLLGATGVIPIAGFGRWWSVLTANYLHGGLLHILFNMLALRQLGPLVVQEFGPARMFVIYTAGGIIGYLVSYYAGIRFTLGASAAVCALIGAILFYGRSRGGSYGTELFRQAGGWAVGIALLGAIIPGINNWAHGSGMAAGVLLSYLMGYQELRPERFIHLASAAALGLATVIALGWTLLTSAVYLASG